jgi:phosphopantothenoylcysteine decarboxylase/phosphopantothenate--cysteine ligase
MNSKIALGVSSSVSIYKACEVLRGFQKQGFDVQVIMTRNATRLISPLLFASLSGLRTIVDMYDEPEARSLSHVSLAEEVALLCVAPATANVIAKFAAGVADDFLTTFYLCVRVPVLVAPAMNEAMYLHPTTQANIGRLKAAGVRFVEPGSGYLACGEQGVGRLAEPDLIVAEAVRLITAGRPLQGRKVLVTAGPTREYLDPVRFLSNPSTGRMGYALAEEARLRGAEVTLVSGPSALEPPAGVKFVRVESAAEMEKAVKREFKGTDAVIMAAAVGDFRFKRVEAAKIKKERVAAALELERTPDILSFLGRNKKKGQLVVGFAAETDDVVDNARRKMLAKKADLMVANRVGGGSGFGETESEAHIIYPSGEVRAVPRAGKREISRAILDCVGELLGKERKG